MVHSQPLALTNNFLSKELLFTESVNPGTGFGCRHPVLGVADNCLHMRLLVTALALRSALNHPLLTAVGTGSDFQVPLE